MGCGPVLLIGVKDYAKDTAFGPLPGIEKDLTAMEATVRALGFTDVTVLTDPDRRGMETAMNAFGGKIKASAKASFFYYSGHGVLQEKLNYLIPARAPWWFPRTPPAAAGTKSRPIPPARAESSVRAFLLSSSPVSDIQHPHRHSRHAPDFLISALPRRLAAAILRTVGEGILLLSIEGQRGESLQRAAGVVVGGGG